MFYKFDTKNLTYEKCTKKVILWVILTLIISFALFSFIMVNRMADIKYISTETKEIIIKQYNKENQFSPEKLKAYILELNIKFPHIVYAQAKLESANFKSDLFKTNNNLFGLKIATRRPSTNKGVNENYAYFDSWRTCVVDYALLQSTFIYDIKTEDEYFQYLKQRYAEDSLYVTKLKNYIKNNEF